MDFRTSQAKGWLREIISFSSSLDEHLWFEDYLFRLDYREKGMAERMQALMLYRSFKELMKPCPSGIPFGAGKTVTFTRLQPLEVK